MPRRPGPRRYYFIEVNVPESSAGRRRPTSTQLSWRRAVDKSFAPVRRPRWARAPQAARRARSRRTASEPHAQRAAQAGWRGGSPARVACVASRRVASRAREVRPSNRPSSRPAPLSVSPTSSRFRGDSADSQSGRVGEPPSSRPKHPTRGRRRIRAADTGDHGASLSATRSHRAAFAPAFPFSDGVASARNRARLGSSIRPARDQRVLPLIYDKTPALPAPQGFADRPLQFRSGPARQAGVAADLELAFPALQGLGAFGWAGR